VVLLTLSDTTLKDGNATKSGSLRLNLRHGLRCVFTAAALNICITLNPHGAVHFATWHFKQFLKRVVGNLSIDALISQFSEIFGG
jgi:hypothetical protein